MNMDTLYLVLEMPATDYSEQSSPILVYQGYSLYKHHLIHRILNVQLLTVRLLMHN